MMIAIIPCAGRGTRRGPRICRESARRVSCHTGRGFLSLRRTDTESRFLVCFFAFLALDGTGILPSQVPSRALGPLVGRAENGSKPVVVWAGGELGLLVFTLLFL